MRDEARDRGSRIRRIRIRDVRPFADLTWELPAGADGAGWHVIIGDNGSGKSSFLRAVARALIGPGGATSFRSYPDDWIRAGASRASIELRLGAPGIPGDARARVTLRRGAHTFGARTIDGRSSSRAAEIFSASYGSPGLGSGIEMTESSTILALAPPWLGRHLSMLGGSGESIALTRALSWLQDLQFHSGVSSQAAALLGDVARFANQPGLSPCDIRLQVTTPEGISLVDASGAARSIRDLPGGCGRILGLILDLIRQMALTYGPVGLFSADGARIARPGIVLIDDIDAHLQPSWQRTIGTWLREHFPGVQFLVSTHSPLVCQAAEAGTIFHLPGPGADPNEDRGEMVTGIARGRLIYGDVLDAYGTGLFGLVARSSSGLEKLEELARLNMRELLGSLSDEERQAQAMLRALLPTSASVGIGSEDADARGRAPTTPRRNSRRPKCRRKGQTR